jgi:hypothetical protein
MPQSKYQGNDFQYENNMKNSSLESTERIRCPLLSAAFFNGKKQGNKDGGLILDFIVARFQLTNAYSSPEVNDCLVNSLTNAVLVVNMGFLGVSNWSPNVHAYDFMSMYKIESSVFDNKGGALKAKIRSYGEGIAEELSLTDNELDRNSSLRYLSGVDGRSGNIFKKREETDLDKHDSFIRIKDSYGSFISRCFMLVPLTTALDETCPNITKSKLDCTISKNTGSIRPGTIGHLISKVDGEFMYNKSDNSMRKSKTYQQIAREASIARGK